MDSFELLLFSVDRDVIIPAVSAGVDGIVVDLESRGKEARQASADTEVNHHTLADLRRVRGWTLAPIICRINGFGSGTAEEVEAVVDAGADEILLPMVRRKEDVEAVLEMVSGRCGVGILVETVDAVERAAALSRLPLSRAYVGLNDLAIDRGSPNLFMSVLDETVAQVRRHFSIPFGFGGLTRPDAGDPIPCRLLIGEMARLECSFSFLRRSFHRDCMGRELSVEVPRIQEALKRAGKRPPEEVAHDHAELQKAVTRVCSPSVGLASV